MATSGDIVCGVCEVENITEYAEHWCPECEQGMCSQCLTYHNALKSTRNHGIISVERYLQLPPSIINIKQYCPDHDRKLKNYCPQHESLCCPLCIPAKHKDCHGILALEDIIKSSKTSTLLDSLGQSLNDIKINIDTIIKNKHQNLETIKTQRQKFYDEIKQMRDKICKHLDKLEQQIMQDLYNEEKKVKVQIESLLKKLSKNTEKVEELQHNISTIKQYASDLQTYLGSKTIENEVQKQEKAMQSIFDDRNVNEVYLKCNIEVKIRDIFATVRSFGTISIEQGLLFVPIKTKKEKQAQIVSIIPSKLKTIYDIDLNLQWKTKLETKCSLISGCTITPSGYIILTDCNNSRLLVLKDTGSFYSEINLSSSNPADVTCVGDRTVAVSFQSACFIEIIDLIGKTKIRTIKTTNYCSGISNRNGWLLYTEHGNGIYRVQLTNGGASPLILENAVRRWDYITLTDNRIYHTIHDKDTVCCYKISGEKIWEYKNTSLLNYPFGVAVDKNSNVFVASYGNHSIIVISADGEQMRCILGEEDGINNPCGICIDKERNNLLVTCYGGTISLYKLT